jgi:invasion protein IalB
MTLGTTVATGGDRGGRLARAAMLALAAAAFALLALGATMGAASATMTNNPQHDYVTNCKESGGTPKSEGTRKVSCTIGDWKQTCDFNYNPPACTLTQVTEDTSPTLEDGVYAQDDPAAGDTGAGGTWVLATTTGTLLAVEDDEQP